MLQWLAFGRANLGSRVRVLTSAGYFSFFDIAVEPRITSLICSMRDLFAIYSSYKIMPNKPQKRKIM